MNFILRELFMNGLNNLKLSTLNVILYGILNGIQSYDLY
jgi:hypothetical protein